MSVTKYIGLMSASIMLVTSFSVAANPLDEALKVVNLDNVSYVKMDFEDYYYVQGINKENNQPASIQLTEKADTFISGDILTRNDKNQLTNQSVRAKLALLNQFKPITFPSKINEIAHINVFTDTTCGYCIKFHNTLVPLLNEQGISVNYYAWPGSGVGLFSNDDMAKIWCSVDPKQALHDAKNGKPVTEDKPSLMTCQDDIVEQYVLGTNFGMRGTPAIVLPNGRMLEGYPVIGPNKLVENSEQLAIWLNDTALMTKGE
ncbi:hypothetical protein A1QO_00685 [Vibrio genomosp. F10 str. ZF-129]|uniref:Thiol:disulfide interchange protein n=1 Tax=Vibrio genomosp. F10 str. ZF-129 TaxID=1187848 RepID=A0A1E5BGC4_9VIBR|nr:DsbC family protein [Vibrio genomosp. F10]OEE35308.1 hypothetical protein A1QO_00685 [Vibrio genomosp. F10 str. ZF-129]